MSRIEEAIRKAKAAAQAKIEVSTARALGDADQGSTRSLRSSELEQVAPFPMRQPFTPEHTLKLDRTALRTAGLLPPEQDEHRLVTEYRALKRGLLGASTGPESQSTRARSIMVASALPGEGKTFTALNLALSFAAERDFSVILIDADVAKPNLSTLLGLQSERGLLDCLAEPGASLLDVMWGTDLPGLILIPAGRSSENATELLSSARMRALLGETKQLDQRTIIVFDSPPVLLTSESRALADVVNQIMLVVRADSTPRNAVTQAVAALGAGRPVGLMLNQVKSATFGHYYGKRYGSADQSA